MPITLNNSNISVTYNTGSNYIIETVKSDLYVRDIRTGISSNLFAEPSVSPTITSNLAVFTHSGGTENQTPHKIYFPENTVCDILIVGGGGGGGGGHGGGGGAGQLVFMHQVTLNGTYNINVGKGGVGGTNPGTGGIEPTKGSNSSFDTVIAEGGGANGGTLLKDGGSGAGGDAWLNGLGTIQKGLKNTLIDTYSSGTIYSKGNDGGTGGNDPGQGAGGGGAGTPGGNGGSGQGSATAYPGNGGDGLSSISEIGYDFKTNFGTNVGKQESDTLVYFAGGGGGGGWIAPSISYGGKGGGGNGGIGAGESGSNAVSNTGSGGGGGAYNYGVGGNGGSGIVIIKIVSPIINKFLFFNYKTTGNIYNLDFKTRTIVNINNGRNNSFNGTYTLTVGTISSTILPTQNQTLLDTTYPSSNLSLSYNLLNPINIGAQWTYTSNNPNVYHMGNVGIGTTSPEYTLDVRGTIYSSIGGYTQSGLTTWSITSDRRIKENIVKASYEKCLENVNKIELYNFNFKDNCVNNNDKHQLGFIAQEVRDVYPKAVEVNKMILNTNETIDDILTLNTTQIDYTLYGAVKNLIEKIDNIDIGLENLGSNITYNKDLIRNTSNIFSIITSNISITTSNIFTGTSNIFITTSNISIITSNIFISTSNIPIDTSNISIGTSNIPIEFSYIPITTSNIPIGTSNIPIGTSNISIN